MPTLINFTKDHPFHGKTKRVVFDMLANWKQHELTPESIFGLEKDYSIESIKKAYRKFSLFGHPDKNKECEKEAEAAFKIITEANTYLVAKKENDIATLARNAFAQDLAAGQTANVVRKNTFRFFKPFRNGSELYSNVIGLVAIPVIAALIGIFVAALSVYSLFSAAIKACKGDLKEAKNALESAGVLALTTAGVLLAGAALTVFQAVNIIVKTVKTIPTIPSAFLSNKDSSDPSPKGEGDSHSPIGLALPSHS